MCSKVDSIQIFFKKAELKGEHDLRELYFKFRESPVVSSRLRNSYSYRSFAHCSTIVMKKSNCGYVICYGNSCLGDRLVKIVFT